MLLEKLKVDVYSQNNGQEEGKVANKFELTNNVFVLVQRIRVGAF